MLGRWTRTHNSRSLLPVAQANPPFLDLMKIKKWRINVTALICELLASVQVAQRSVKRQVGKPEMRRMTNVILIYDSKVEIVMNISEPAFSVFDDDEEFWMTFRVRHLSWWGKWESPENFQFDVCLGWLRMRVGEWWIFLALALRWGGVNGNERGGWVESELEFWMRNTKQTSWQLCFVSWHAINSKYLSSRRSTASHRLS